MRNPSKQIIRLFIWTVYSIQSLMYVFAGSIHLDEGAYMYASRAVYLGKLPYRDFFFLQPPVHPYIYGIFQKISPGLLTGRLTSVFLGVITILFLARLVDQRTQDKSAGLLFLALMTMCPFQIYFFTITRLYALTTLFIAIGSYFLFSREKPSLLRWTIGLPIMSLALGTRLTLLPFILYGFLYVMIRGRRISEKLLPVAISIAVILIIYIPFIVIAGPQRIWFNLLGMNLSLHSNNLQANLIQKARATSQLIRFYFPLWLLFVPLLMTALKNRKEWSIRNAWHILFSPTGALWTGSVGMLIVHSSAKLYQVSYQSVIMPVFSAAIAIAWIQKWREWNPDARRMGTFSIAIMLFLGIAAYGRTSISIIDGKPSLLALWEQADFVRNNTAPDSAIFSADSALVATEAERDILTGMAGSDLFADWSTQDCRYFNVLNFEIMEKYIQEQKGGLLAYGDMSFGLSLPYLEPIPNSKKDSLKRLINKHYNISKSFPNLMLPGTKTHYCLPGTTQQPKNILVFGMDAAAWDVVVPLCEKGLLPTISTAMNQGVTARLKTLHPTVSVMLWTTIATGMLPNQHGIDNWISESMDSSGQLAITSDRRKVPAFWNVIQNKKILLSNWWATWPVEEINGVMISNRAHFENLSHTVYPPLLEQQIAGKNQTRRQQLNTELNDLNPMNTNLELPEYAIQQLLRDRFYLDHTYQQLQKGNFNLAAVFVRGIDILEHEYLRDVLPDEQSIPAVPSSMNGIVQTYYCYLDSWLAKLLESMGPETGLLIVSDHGMDPVTKLPPLLEGLDINKLLLKIESPESGSSMAHHWIDNKNYSPGLIRGLKWNQPGSPTISQVNHAVNRLKSITVDGAPLFSSIELSMKNDETIRITLNANPTHQSTIHTGQTSIPVMSVTSMIIHPRSGQHWHSPDGIFILSGPGINADTQRKEINILDVMPTLTTWTGNPVSRALDGSPRLDMFTEEFLNANPVAFIDSYQHRKSISTIQTPADIEENIRKELESLGYIETSGD